MATKRRKTTRRRVTRRRRRNLGAVPIYPPVLGITGMPLTFATVGPLAGLGSSPAEHIQAEKMTEKEAANSLREASHFAGVGQCERALDNFARGMALAGQRKAHESAAGRYSGLVKAEMDSAIDKAKHKIAYCFVNRPRH